MSAPRAEAAAPRAAAPPEQELAVDVRDLHKSFRIPTHQVSTLKERALHPFHRAAHTELDVLRGVSFSVEKGEFFGIVGRNGSGKSTLLKCLAEIYAADSGRIAVAGRLAPFIELGVGFNPDLNAHDNVLINAVMMGLSPKQARASFDAIIAFAELEEFAEMKLKNYSSGMQVRLAFSTMVHTQADILLIDEVLAVGDAAFQQKCFDVFYELRARGTTIILVTHDMTAIERFCHRAMLLSEGRIEYLGAPDEVGRRYLVRNFRTEEGAEAEEPAEAAPDVPAAPPTSARATVLDAWAERGDHRRADAVGFGETFTLRCVLESHEDIDRARFDVWIDADDATRVFGAEASARVFAASTMGWREGPRGIRAGERITVSVELENRLTSGRYRIGCSLLSGSAGQDVVVLEETAGTFVTFGGDEVYGLVGLDHDVALERSGPQPAR